MCTQYRLQQKAPPLAEGRRAWPGRWLAQWIEHVLYMCGDQSLDSQHLHKKLVDVVAHL